MASNGRTNQSPTSDYVKKLLNTKQLAAFQQSIYFGWRLGFVRRSLFYVPVFVIYNAEYELIGFLAADGHIRYISFTISKTLLNNMCGKRP